MARLRTTLPLNATNEFLGTVLDLGTLNRSPSAFSFENGTVFFNGEIFSVDTILRGRNLTSGTSGRVSGIEFNFNDGEESYIFDQFDASVLQVANAIDGDFDNIVRLVGRGADEFLGSQGDDKMRSYGGDDLIEGRGGDDSLIADAGDDLILGGTGNDSIFAGAGDDDVDGGDGDDFQQLAGGNDVALGGASDDTINGQAGNDRITGGRGADSINGGSGADTLIGQSGSDFIKGGGRGDLITAGGGRDTIKAGAGDDIVNGNGGRDLIDGGAGADLLIGGGGRDTFIFRNNSGDDIVRGFTVDKDKIDLSAVRDISDFNDLMANHLRIEGDDLVIDLSDKSDLTIENIGGSDFDEADFIF